MEFDSVQPVLVVNFIHFMKTYYHENTKLRRHEIIYLQKRQNEATSADFSIFIFQSTDFADYTDYNDCGVEIAKSAGFNSPQLAALRSNLSLIDTPWLAVGNFNLQFSAYSWNRQYQFINL